MTADKITVEAIKIIANQARKGVETYGCGVSDAKLSLREWLVHLAEEQADSLVYILRAIKEIDSIPKSSSENCPIPNTDILNRQGD